MRKGFTLLEVMVALAILSAGIVALLALFSSSLRLAAGSKDVSAATIYAGQRLEEALLAPSPAPGEESGAFGERYRWTAKTTFLPPEEDPPLQPVRIEVSVRWNDAGRERSVEMAATRWDRRDTRDGG